MGKKPTIDDVARLAGVARATVSRVLNASPNTSERVRAQVMQAIAELGYRVNHQARQLASGSSRSLALVFAADAEAEPNSYYNSAVELGAMRQCVERGYSLSTHILDPGRPGVRSLILDLADRKRCDGLILTPPFSDDVDLIRSIQDREFPLALISAGPEASGLASNVGIDDRQAGFELGKHIVELGHRSFGFISGPPNHKSAALRLEGFLDAVESAGLQPSAVDVVEGNFTFKSGIDWATRLLSGRERPTSLVCANDDMAAGAMFAAHRLGFAVPNDLSITGFDDTPVSQIVWPPLTTIHQPLRQMGARAVELLIGSKTGENGPAGGPQVLDPIPYELISRSSTKKAHI